MEMKYGWIGIPNYQGTGTVHCGAKNLRAAKEAIAKQSKSIFFREGGLFVLQNNKTGKVVWSAQY